MTDSKKISKFTSDVQQTSVVQAEVASALALLENLSTKSSESGLSEDTCWELFGGPCPEALRKKIKYLKQNTPLREEEEEDEEESTIIIISMEDLQEKEGNKVDKREKENVHNLGKELQETSSKDDNINNRYNEMITYDGEEGSNLFSNSEIPDRKRISQEKTKMNLEEISYLPENKSFVGYKQSIENKIENKKERSSKDSNVESHKFEITGQGNLSIQDQSRQENRLSWDSHKIMFDRIKMSKKRTASSIMKDELSKENREKILSKENNPSEKSKIYDNIVISKDRLASDTLEKKSIDYKSLEKINSRGNGPINEKLPNNNSKIASLGKVNSKNISNEEKMYYQNKISKQNSLPNETYTKNNISNELEENSKNEISNNDKQLENNEKHTTTNASNVELDQKYSLKISDKGLESIEGALLSKQSTISPEKKSILNELDKNRVSNDHRTSLTKNGNKLTEESITNKNGAETHPSKQDQQRTESVSIGTTTVQEETTVKRQDSKRNAEIYARNLSKAKTQSVSIGTASSLIGAGIRTPNVSRNESVEKPPIKISAGSEEKQLSEGAVQQSSTSKTSGASESNSDGKKIREKSSKRVSTSTSDSNISSSEDASSLTDNNYNRKFNKSRYNDIKNCNCACCVERQIRKSYEKEKNQCKCCKKKPTQCHRRDDLQDNKNFQIKIFENNSSSKTADNENKILSSKKVQTSEIMLINENKNQIPCPYMHNIEQLLLNSGYLRPAYPDRSRRSITTKRDKTNKKECKCSGDFKQQSTPVSLEDSDLNENSRSPSKCSYLCDVKNNEEHLSLADSLKNALLRRTVKNTVKKFENRHKFSLFMCSDTPDDMQYQQPKNKPKNFMHKGEIHLPIPKNKMCECCHKPKQMVRKRPNVPTPNPFICCNHGQYYQ